MAGKTPKPVRAPKVKPDRSENVRNDRKRKGETDEPQGMTVAGHPRASTHVRRAKGWGGLLGFLLAGLLSVGAGVPLYTVGERAIAAGVAGYLIAWAASVTIWRQLMIAELRHAAEMIEAQRKAASDAAHANAVPERF
jgi:hypothetical protein